MKKKVKLDDETEFDDEAHASLLNEIKKISSNSRIGAERIVRVSSEAARVVDKNEILKRIGDSTLVKKNKTQKSLPKPLEKPQAKRLKRAIGYEEVAVDANKWGGVVHQRRKADQLKFPLEEVDVRVITTEKNFVPPMQSDLEKEIYPLLYGAKLLEEKKETEEELKVKRAMSLKEVREKSKEIWRRKLLQQRLEKKASLINKSKSRKFHQILRREKLKKKKEDFENLQKNDPERALDLLNDIEKSRIQERMDLRHRNSKWLHLQKDRASRDKNVLELLNENKEVCIEILKKFKEPQKESDDENSDDEFRINEAVELSENNKAHEEMDDEEQRDDFIKFQSQIEQVQKQATAQETTGSSNNEKEEVAQNAIMNTTFSSRQLGSARIQDPSTFREIYDFGSDDEDDDQTVGNFDNIYEDDELIKEFQMDKQRREEEKSKVTETSSLKGWGSWAGPGIKTNPRNSNRKRKILRTNPDMKPTNAYSAKPHVIYNESSDVHKNIRKHMVSELPFPFTRVKDFEASVRQSLGRKFVPEGVHNMLIAPPIVKKSGVVINPINEDALLKGYRNNKKKLSKVEEQLNEKLHPNTSKKHKKGGRRKKQNSNLSIKPFEIHK